MLKLEFDDCLTGRLVLDAFKRKDVKLSDVEIFKDGSGEVALFTDDGVIEPYYYILDWLYGYGKVDLSETLNLNIADYKNDLKQSISASHYRVGFVSLRDDVIKQNERYLLLNGECSFVLFYRDGLKDLYCAIVGEENGRVTYRLNRLGVPLVEIDTGILEGYSPQELQEIAYQIGILARSTNKTKHGIGSIRQDVNISIRNGPRTEVKGVQELGLLSKIVEFEVQRQMKEKPKEETRAANLDGTTRFLRPLPGANRMYPETDIPPVIIKKDYLDELKKNLPEPWTNKLDRFKTKLKLPDGLAREILGSEYLNLFEKIVSTKKVEPTIVASTFTSTIKDLERREKVELNRISEHRLVEIFDYLQDKKITKEAIPEIIKYLATYPQNGVSDALKELDLKPLTSAEVRQITEEILSQQSNMPFEKIYGIVMSKVRGKIDAQEVMKIVKSMMK